MRPLAGRGKRHSGLPLRAFSRAGVLQSRKARRFCQDAHDLREAPSQKLRAPVLQASESSLRLPKLVQRGNRLDFFIYFFVGLPPHGRLTRITQNLSRQRLGHCSA